MEDQSKFFNVIIDKTNQKLNSFQAQIIVLESQLQMAIDERDTYKKYVDGIPSLNFNITELENTKKEYEQCRFLLDESFEEIDTYKLLIKSLEEANNEKLKVLEDKNAELELKVSSGSSYLRDQNETLLQEIRRLQRLVSELS
jgi:transcription antitermination factor NusA-like protein